MRVEWEEGLLTRLMRVFYLQVVQKGALGRLVDPVSDRRQVFDLVAIQIAGSDF